MPMRRSPIGLAVDKDAELRRLQYMEIVQGSLRGGTP